MREFVNLIRLKPAGVELVCGLCFLTGDYCTTTGPRWTESSCVGIDCDRTEPNSSSVAMKPRL